MNDKDKKGKDVSDKVVDAIVALKQKSEQVSSENGGVDLMSIVKKLSRNRERASKAKTK